MFIVYINLSSFMVATLLIWCFLHNGGSSIGAQGAVHIDCRLETASSFADNGPLDTSNDPSKDNHSTEHGWFTIAKALEIVVLICFVVYLFCCLFVFL